MQPYAADQDMRTIELHGDKTLCAVLVVLVMADGVLMQYDAVDQMRSDDPRAIPKVTCNM